MDKNYISPQISPNENLATFICDMYELEKHIYALSTLKDNLLENRHQFQQKELNKFPQKPPIITPKKRIHPKDPISQKKYKPLISEEIISLELKKIEEEKSRQISIQLKKFLAVAILCPIIFFMIFGCIGKQVINNFFVGVCIAIILSALIIFICYKNYKSKALKIQQKFTKNSINKRKELDLNNAEIKAYNDQITKKNEEIEYKNKKIDDENALIDTENSLILQKNANSEKQYERDLAIANAKYKLNCEAYRAQIDFVSDSLNELLQIREKMYAFDILPPDYCELKHLHYFDHYFKNRLVDNIKDAVIMYRQDAFQEMVGLSLGNILASINSLTGEVRMLGMTLKKIQADVGVISAEVFQSRLIQEELLDKVQEGFDSMQFSAHEIMEETRAQRYASETIKDSTSRLIWYEEQRRLGHL